MGLKQKGKPSLVNSNHVKVQMQSNLHFNLCMNEQIRLIQSFSHSSLTSKSVLHQQFDMWGSKQKISV